MKPEYSKVIVTGGNVGKVIPIRCDVSDLAMVEAAFAEANKDGVVQALVNSAGEVGPCRAEQLTAEMVAMSINSMLFGAFNVCRTWTRALLKAGQGGSFIAYTSTVNSRETPGLSHSGMAKAGVESMIRSWAARYITGSTMMVDGGLRLRSWFGFTPEDLAGLGEPV